MVVGKSPGLEHLTKEVEGKYRKLILGKRGDNRAPIGGGLTRGFVENLAGKKG